MSLLPLFIFCIQVCFIQATYSQCTGLAPTQGVGYPGGFYGGIGYGNILGFGNRGYGISLGGVGYPNIAPAWTPAIAPFMPGPLAGSYGGVGNGVIRLTGELPVAGTTRVAGQVPIIGAVQFSGNMPAAGTVIITGGCGCGRGYKGYFY